MRFRVLFLANQLYPLDPCSRTIQPPRASYRILQYPRKFQDALILETVRMLEPITRKLVVIKITKFGCMLMTDVDYRNRCIRQISISRVTALDCDRSLRQQDSTGQEIVFVGTARVCDYRINHLKSGKGILIYSNVNLPNRQTLRENKMYVNLPLIVQSSTKLCWVRRIFVTS